MGTFATDNLVDPGPTLQWNAQADEFAFFSILSEEVGR